MSNNDLDAFLASPASSGPAGQSRCLTCRDYGHMNPDILEFMRRKAAGEIHLPTVSVTGQKSLWTFLQSRGYALSNSTLIRHITLCLGVNHKTGRPLDEQT